MSADDPQRRRQGSEEAEFQESVRRKAERRLRARRRGDEGVWHWLGMFGLVGWAVAVPTLLGIAAGAWIDRRWDGDISWTLSLLFLGVVVGCLHAWYWISQERNGE